MLASRMIGSVLLSQGFDVKVSEVHGMSQRGGSVVTYVKYGEDVASPVIEKGQADMIISFEALEAARWVSFLKKGGRIVTNTQQIEPMPVITGAAEYPADIVENIRALGIDVTALDALSLAEEAGTSRAVNVVLMGVVSNMLGIDEAAWTKALEECVPKKVIEVNRKAFALGRAVRI